MNPSKPKDIERARLRLWFDCYQIALDTHELKQDIHTSGAGRIWQEVTVETNFDAWWKDHKHAFGAQGVLVNDFGDEQFYPFELHLVIPLSLPETELLEQCRNHIQLAKAERADAMRSALARDELPDMGVHLPPGTELRESAMINVKLYRLLWHPVGTKPKVDKELIGRAKAFLTPHEITYTALNHDDPEVQKRALHRYLDRGRELIESAAMNVFPRPPARKKAVAE